MIISGICSYLFKIIISVLMIAIARITIAYFDHHTQNDK